MENTFSLIIPVYRNEGTIDNLLEEITTVAKSIPCKLEAIFVVDGSPDNSFASLSSKLPNQIFASKLVSLSRNFGSFIAIRKGLETATGNYYGVMAADCQEPPELMVEALTELIQDNADVVVGRREARDEPFIYRTLSQLFWRIYRKTVVKDMPKGGVDIFACSKKVRDALLSLPETHSSIIAQLYWVGFRRKELGYSRRKRTDGQKSGWTFQKRLAYMSDSIFAFTDIPVRLLLIVGMIGTIFSIFSSIGIIFAWAVGLIDVPGYTPIILLLLLMFTTTLLGFGIVGSYAWRAYENTKSRPLGIVLFEETFTQRSGAQ